MRSSFGEAGWRCLSLCIWSFEAREPTVNSWHFRVFAHFVSWGVVTAYSLAVVLMRIRCLLCNMKGPVADSICWHAIGAHGELTPSLMDSMHVNACPAPPALRLVT